MDSIDQIWNVDDLIVLDRSLTLEMCEQLYGLKLIGKRLCGESMPNGYHAVEECIDRKIATELPNDDFVSEQIVPKLIEMTRKCRSMTGVTNQETQYIIDIYFKAFCRKNWANSWLKLFSFYVEKLSYVENINVVTFEVEIRNALTILQDYMHILDCFRLGKVSTFYPHLFSLN